MTIPFCRRGRGSARVLAAIEKLATNTKIGEENTYQKLEKMGDNYYVCFVDEAESLQLQKILRRTSGVEPSL